MWLTIFYGANEFSVFSIGRSRRLLLPPLLLQANKRQVGDSSGFRELDRLPAARTTTKFNLRPLAVEPLFHSSKSGNGTTATAAAAVTTVLIQRPRVSHNKEICFGCILTSSSNSEIDSEDKI